ncbi:MAG: hypothetical protein AB1730_11670 [Myxococcota bacterium]|jgi:hypothetical protein
MQEDGELLEADVDALAVQVAALEAEVEARRALRSERAAALQAVKKARRLPRDEGEPAWVAWRLLATAAGLVLVVGGAWALDQSLGSVAIVGALALLIWEAAA